jgi:WD40 repeat protein
VDLDPTGDLLAVHCQMPAPAVHFVRVSTGRPADGWSAPRVPESRWVRFAPDGSAVLVGGPSGLTVFDPKTGRVTHTAAGPAEAPPAISADARLVASGDRNVVRVWDVATGRSVAPAAVDDAPAAEVHGLAVSADGRTVVTKGKEDGEVRVWGWGGGLLGTARSESWGGGALAVGSDGRHAYGVSADRRAVVRWDLPGGRESARFPVGGPGATFVSVKRIGLSADGRRLAVVAQSCASGGDVTAVTVWDTADARCLQTRRLAGARWGERGALSPDLRWYFAGGRAVALADGPDRLFDLPAGWEAEQPTVSPDGRLAAWAVSEVFREGQWSFRQSQGILVHETATGRPVLRLPAWNRWEMAFTPDGRGLVVAGEHTLTRWDLATRKPVVRHRAPDRLLAPVGTPFAGSLAVTPDGRRAVTGHADTTALVWDITPPARPGRRLTGPELEAAWADLGGDAAQAYAAIWALADAPADAVPFLTARLAPAVGPTEDEVRKLFGRLDAAAFAEREAAERELRRLGAAAVPVLRDVLRAGASAEQADRAGRVLAATARPAGEALRRARAAAALAGAGTAEARWN